jgi:hypothetical protein
MKDITDAMHMKGKDQHISFGARMRDLKEEGAVAIW